MKITPLIRYSLIYLFINIYGVSVAQVNQDNLKKHVYFLAADKMKGRATGSKEGNKAAKYIQKHFKKYKLLPKGKNKFAQPFEAHVTRAKVRDSIRSSKNIIGYLDNGAEFTIVVGAHYDHLGLGTDGGSKDTSRIGHIHNGADDNASGVAGLLELARHYATNNVKEPYNMLFIAFGAEELGLLGSKHFVENPTLPLNEVHWMLNFDMIGRYNPDNGLAVIGYGTSPQFEPVFQNISPKPDFSFYTSKEGRGGSDQTSFYDKKIPVLFFHTGGHPDYHMTSDTAEKVNYPGMEHILHLAIEVIDKSMAQKKMIFTPTD